MKLKEKRILVILLAGTLILLAALCAVLMIGEYAAEPDALNPGAAEACGIQISRQGGGYLVFAPQQPEVGLIFYPGANVEYSAYTPLLTELAKQGILCIDAEMPADNALFRRKAADGARALFPEIDIWYVGGHSLGGSAAALYLRDCAEEYEGLLLLASFSSADLSGTDLKVISVYGENDGVLNIESYDKYFSNLPQPVSELIIPGGNHAQFGSYGEQKGDGAAAISEKEQIAITAEFVAEHMLNG